MVEKIDAHHHLWSYTPQEYGWINDNLKILRRDFLVSDLQIELAGSGFDGSVAVQARQSWKETEWLLALAEQNSVLRGVVGWADIASDGFPAQLETLSCHHKLKGLRHVVQDEPDDEFILRGDFNRGIGRLRETNLVYDILIFDKHLPAAIRFVDMHPNQVFVLDHMAKPRIREGLLEPWRRDIVELARRKNVFCKLSGLVTEANWATWSVHDLQPYVEVVLEAFTPTRLMAGSDWPVCLLASSYSKWMETLGGMLGGLSEFEKERIFGGTATEVYRLQV